MYLSAELHQTRGRESNLARVCVGCVDVASRASKGRLGIRSLYWVSTGTGTVPGRPTKHDYKCSRTT